MECMDSKLLKTLSSSEVSSNTHRRIFSGDWNLTYVGFLTSLINSVGNLTSLSGVSIDIDLLIRSVIY